MKTFIKILIVVISVFLGGIALLFASAMFAAISQKNLVGAIIAFVIMLFFLIPSILCFKNSGIHIEFKASEQASGTGDAPKSRYRYSSSKNQERAEDSTSSEQDRLGLNKEERKTRDTIYLSDAQLLGIERGELPTIIENEAILHTGERAVYSAAAVLLITKKRAVGRKNAGAGISFRVARGVSVHTGSGESHTVFGEVTEKYSGRVIVTNQRVIFLQGQKGFDQKLDNLTALMPYSDGVGFQFGSNTYTLATTAPRFILQTVQRVRNL